MRSLLNLDERVGSIPFEGPTALNRDWCLPQPHQLFAASLFARRRPSHPDLDQAAPVWLCALRPAAPRESGAHIHRVVGPVLP